MMSDDDDLDSILAGLDDDSIVQVKSSDKEVKESEEVFPIEETPKDKPKEKTPPPIPQAFKREKTDIKKIVKEKWSAFSSGFIAFFTIGDEHASKARMAFIFAIYGLLFSIFGIGSALAFLGFKSPHQLTAENIKLQSFITEVAKSPAPVVLSKNAAPQLHSPAAQIEYKKENTPHGDTAPFDFYKDKSVIPSSGHKKIAIIIADVGLNSNRLQDVFKQSPSHTTLAFSPYADIVRLEKDEQKTFENWLVLPTEKTNEAYDPGIFGLYNSRDIDLNINSLNSLLNHKNNFTGFIIPSESAIPEEKEQYSDIVKRIYELGYGIADASNATIAPDVLTSGLPNFPYFQIDLELDKELSPQAINAAFNKLEIIAEENKQAIGLIHSYPISLELYNYWANTLDERGFVLVPLSALFKKAGITKLTTRQTATHEMQQSESQAYVNTHGEENPVEIHNEKPHHAPSSSHH